MTRVKDIEYLPCPFCGGECDPEGWLGGNGERGPECETCGATTSTVNTWNYRVNSIPTSAIRCEAVVEVDPYENDLHYVCVDIDEYRHLPQFDKGCKVEVWVIPKEDI